ncbi:MAG TPA: hypothetical protein VLH79_06240 [Chthonomonadales bacterium]|nr:hypothetical protein [Chthonomonadales bacterium]
MTARCAAIDVGTNTVKLTVAEADGTGAFRALVDTSTTTRLGEGIHAGRLREAAIRRTLDAIAAYAATCREHGARRIAAVGTSALRDAVNGVDFVRRAAEHGVAVEPIGGDEEARLSFLAVRRDQRWRDAGPLLVVDIGGGSTELILGDGAGPVARVSLQLGAVRLTEAFLRGDPPTVVEIDVASRAAEEAIARSGVSADGSLTAVGVGGTFTNLGAVQAGEARPSFESIHGRVLALADVEDQAALFAGLTVEQRKQVTGLDPMRADIILAGAIIAIRAMSAFGQERIAVSCRGLRWGLLYDRFGT